MITIVASIIAGIALGYMYALLLIKRSASLFCADNNAPQRSSFILALGSVGRLALLGAALAYLLLYINLHLILMVVCCIVTIWVTVLNTR